MDQMTLAAPKDQSKGGHGGKRTNAGRKPQGEAPRDDLKIPVDRQVVAQLRFVAESQGISAAELATRLLRDPVQVLFDKATMPRRSKGKGGTDG